MRMIVQKAKENLKNWEEAFERMSWSVGIDKESFEMYGHNEGERIRVAVTWGSKIPELKHIYIY